MQKRPMAIRFLRGELLDYSTYLSLLKAEKNKEFAKILGELAKTEYRHARIWAKVAGVSVESQKVSRLRIYLFLLARRILGLTFAAKLLELNEISGASAYAEAVKEERNEELKRQLEEVLKDEIGHEEKLRGLIEERETELQYIKSIVFGLNDGLVEILAIVVGLAIVATSSAVVALAGIVAGISGTLSMAGGAYLSAKSEMLVSKKGANTTPAKEAYFTGFYYFIGALLSILPFAFGLKGYEGIGVAIAVVSIAIAIVSMVIAVISEVSIKRRIGEMLAISLGASFVTILVSTFAKYYLHIVI